MPDDPRLDAVTEALARRRGPGMFGRPWTAFNVTEQQAAKLACLRDAAEFLAMLDAAQGRQS